MENFLDQIIMPPLLIGLVFLALAFFMYVFPPRKINSFYGYRTVSSMKSQERWDFSQRYSAIQFAKGGIMLILLSLLGLVLPYSTKTENYIGAAITMLIIGLIIWSVEKAIKTRFNNQ